ncbi:SLC13 family permease [Halogeometricum luteum]|uniref:SLC13 family permease n=1 Tax=Halogeometricum luteum TaxID=2950537 RepID=A0ABU2G3U9_9EURY|nr:SLC13 family permease [Halogeometricum sp. S3BR5-2]MDS0295462.1 SLC13 family permease [Halogeometricum sp. S3BR5-2]
MPDDARADDEPTLARADALGIAAAVAVLAWGALAEPSAFAPNAQDVMAVFGFALVLWLTEAVPYVVSSTLAVVLLVVFGAAPSFAVAASGFASSLVFFLLLVFLLGAAIDEVNLDRWFASRLRSTGGSAARPFRSLASNLFALAFLMPSAVARAVTFVPVVRRVRDAYGLDPGGGFERSSFLVLGHVNPVASLALMTGGGMALVTAEIVRSGSQSVTWLEWAALMIPPVAALYALSAATAGYLYGAAAADASVGEGVESDGGTAGGTVGALTRDQRIVAATMAGAVCLWLLGSLTGLPAIVPAALAVAVLALPGIEILTAADAADVSWGILFVVGAMFSVLDRMEATGALGTIVEAATGAVPFHAMPHWQGAAVLLGVAVCVRALFSTGSAAMLVVLPVALRIGGEIGLNRLFLALAVVLVVGSTTVFPFNTTAVLVSMEEGPLDGFDVLAFGLVTMLYSLVVVAVAWAVYWPAVTAALG